MGTIKLKLMKKIAYLLLITILVGTSSCQKYLDTKPQDFIAPQTYYTTDAQLTAALMAVYDVMGQNGGYGRNLAVELALASDEGFCRSSTGVLPYFYNSSASDANVLAPWQAMYTGIERANLLLQNLNNGSATQATKDEIKGEALFLRAYYYFVLVSYWGDVPLKLLPSGSLSDVNIARTPAKDVYAQIVKDMTTSEPLVNDIATWGFGGRVSKSAVRGILARVCLSAAGRLNDATYYPLALNWASKVINSGTHSLNTDYTQVFINYLQDKYDIKESIWEVEFFGNGIGTNYNESGAFETVFGVTNTDTDPAGWSYGLILNTAKLYNSYKTGDVRRDWTISPWTYSGNKGTVHTNYAATNPWRYIGKYRRELELVTPHNKNTGPCNFPLLRYSDVLLMFAEAENQVNGPTAAAYNAINQVRRRAYGKPLTAADVTVDVTAGLNKDDFFTAIKDERFRELAFEGVRKLDLMRWGTFLQAMKDEQADLTANGSLASSAWPGTAIIMQTYTNATSRDLLQPIPTVEMSLNQSMKQNPNW
jgi:starch-binding outer membrane protein, SusD/RagB family